MKPGPKPLPSNIKLLRGDRAHRPANKAEPTPEVTAPQPPKDLTSAGWKYWEDYVSMLVKMRVMTDADTMALAMLCESTATYWHCRAKACASETATEKADLMQANRYLNQTNQAFRQMQQMLCEFGLTPSSRTRVSVK